MDKVTLNVSGKIFVTYWKTLQRFPETRLGKLSKNSENYDSHKNEFFFDRNPKLITSILDLYRGGGLHFPANMCSACIKQELLFWDISEDLISECCWKRYNIGQDDKTIVDIIDASLGRFPELCADDSLKRKISLTLEYPQYSRMAMIWNMLNMTMVITITIVVMIGTVDALRDGHPAQNAENKTISQLDVLLSTDIVDWLYYTEIICLVFFSLDMIARFITCPSKKKFIKNWMNIIDFTVDWIMWVAFLLDFAGDIIGHTTDLKIAIHILKALFCLNILRLWHFVRQYPMMKILILTFKASFKQLFLLCVGLLIAVVVYATLIYFIELTMQVDTFRNIPIALWWAVITMTTVGYGDYHPQSTPGYIVGVLCSLSGILLLAMPVAIIASNFTAYYSNMTSRDQRKRRNKILRKTAVVNDGFVQQDNTELEDFNEADFKEPNVKQNGITKNQIVPLSNNQNG